MTLDNWNALFGILGVSVAGALLLLWRSVVKLLANILTPEEKLLLKAARETGDLFLLNVEAIGSWVRAGRDADFISPGDPAYTARFRDAFDKLLARNLIRHEGGYLFRLTGEGFKAANRL